MGDQPHVHNPDVLGMLTNWYKFGNAISLKITTQKDVNNL